MLQNVRFITLFIFSLSVISFNASSAPLVKRTFCIWDPVGANGPFVNLMKDIKIQSLKWGVALHLKAYSDESVASNDFKAGQCDAVAVTEISARQYNSFAGSIGAVGALPTLAELKLVLQAFAQPKAAKFMSDGSYEVAGILPIGPIYTFVNDRSIDGVDRFQGKKMAVFKTDPVQHTMSQRFGTSAVGSSLARFAGQFNNGSVDIAFAPATAYMPMELYKGIEANGGVIKRPLLQATLQIIIHQNKFPSAYGQQSREAFAGMIDRAFTFINEAEKDILEEYWITMSSDATAGLDDLFRASRIALRNDGIYNPKTLRVMRKVRCKHAPTEAECAEKTE